MLPRPLLIDAGQRRAPENMRPQRRRRVRARRMAEFISAAQVSTTMRTSSLCLQTHCRAEGPCWDFLPPVQRISVWRASRGHCQVDRLWPERAGCAKLAGCRPSPPPTPATASRPRSSASLSGSHEGPHGQRGISGSPSRSDPWLEPVLFGCDSRAAEAHIRSPPRAAAPRSLILEVTGLWGAEPIFTAASLSSPDRRSVRPDLAGRQAPRGMHCGPSGGRSDALQHGALGHHTLGSVATLLRGSEKETGE